MGYRRSILVRWSHRDKLAILVIAVTVAFLTGTTIVLTAAGNQTTAIADDYGSDGTATYYDSVGNAQAQASSNALVLPVAEVTSSNGSGQYVIGIPPDEARAFRKRTGIGISDPPSEGVSVGSTSGITGKTRRLSGANESLTVPIIIDGRADSGSAIPPTWYRTTPATVERLGVTGAFVIQPSLPDSAAVPTTGVPLGAALAFFVAGTRQLLSVIALLALGGAVLVGVIVHSVTRMTVRDRIRAIQLIRSTGGTPNDIRRLFALRALLMTTVGVGAGYAFGVIATSAAVNLAVASGFPVSLSVRVTPDVATLLLMGYGGLGLTGLVAGVGAAWPASQRPPAAVRLQEGQSQKSADSSGVLPTYGSLTLLDWRALLPSTATLVVFATVVLIGASVAGVLTPLMDTGGTTITEPGAVHPVASKVPSSYATTLQKKGIAASPEILLFSVHDGKAIVVRGVEFSSFAAVSDATLTKGHKPRTSNEALVGKDLATGQNIEVGDSITLGGSTTSSFTRVKVIGTYAAPGIYDDQLLVSLRTGQHLSNAKPGMVHFIRTKEKLTKESKSQPAVSILDISAPQTVTASDSAPVRVRVKNFGATTVSRTIRVHTGNTSRTKTITLEPHAQRTITVRVPFAHVGTQQLHVSNQTTSITVVSPNALRLEGLPNTVPPSSSPRIRVTTATGRAVSNATVRVGNLTVTTGSDGSVRVPFESPGAYTVTAKRQGRSAQRTILVSPNATKTLIGRVQVRPNRPSLTVRPHARMTLYNPWQTEMDERVVLSLAGNRYARELTVDPGKNTTTELELARAAPGSYTVQMSAAGRPLDSESYTVTGDKRIVTAYANQGAYSGGSGIGRILETAFGNLSFLVGILSVLAGIMTIGSTTAMFAQAIHARRQAIGVHRATGASPRQIAGIVLSDALKIGVVATGVALVSATALVTVLAWSGFLTVFGIQITPQLTLTVVGIVIVGELTIVFCSAFLIVLELLRQQPVSLFKSVGVTPGVGEDSRGEHHG